MILETTLVSCFDPKRFTENIKTRSYGINVLKIYLGNENPEEGERVTLHHFHERVGEIPGQDKNFKFPHRKEKTQQSCQLFFKASFITQMFGTQRYCNWL